MDNAIAANLLGTLGALIPQIVLNYRRHNTIGLQPSMMMLWAWAGIPLGVYNITENFNIALQIQPQLLTLLSLLTWAQCCYYDWKHWPISRCLAVTIPIAGLMAGIQIGLVFALRAAKQSPGAHLTWPSTLMAVLSAVLLAAGVLRHYWDIYRHRSVRGISFLFVGIDAAGDVFSLASVFFQPKLDVLGMVIYGTELVLWLGVFAAGGYFNFLPWVRARLRSASSEARPESGCSAGPGVGATSGVMLQHVPSSTSVFRTASLDLADGGARSRPRFVIGNRGPAP
ncbi:hypothetical protein RB593_007349 [Gaeumannomyces tritici]